MTTKAHQEGFVPPPHPNARTHRRVMALLESMTPQEALALSVKAGIHTPDGKLTAPYKPPEEQGPGSKQSGD